MSNCGVREVEETVRIPLNTKRDLNDAKLLPSSIYECQPDSSKIICNWSKFIDSVKDSWTIRRRHHSVGNKYVKDAVFRASMENICNDFSRTNYNVQVKFVERKVAGDKYDYSLHVFRLNDVSHLIRNMGQTQTAEIPSIPMEAEAEVVGISEEDVTTQRCTGNNTVSSITVTEGNVLAMNTNSQYHPRPRVRFADDTATTTTTTTTTEIDETVPSTPVLVTLAPIEPTAQPMTQQQQQQQQQQERRSALERMQELDSIRTYLTDDEYQQKRQDILNDI